MKTTAQWWAEVKADPDKMIKWLTAQLHGEAEAYDRIGQFRETYRHQCSPNAYKILGMIMQQEAKHADWIQELLAARVRYIATEHKDRYWKEVLPEIEDFQSGCAVGAHAEAMRLERIRLIAHDPDCDSDIRECFQRILPEEEFHARAFAEMAGPILYGPTIEAHARGLEALGLII